MATPGHCVRACVGSISAGLTWMSESLNIDTYAFLALRERNIGIMSVLALGWHGDCVP
jgi:hypothetical protein